MIEEIVLNYLKDNLDVDVFLETPSNHSDTYVTMKLIGSGMDNHINAATFEFYCYSQSKYESAVLDRMLKEAMLGNESTSYGIIELSTISACKYGGGNDAPDTSKKAYRYRSYYNLFY